MATNPPITIGELADVPAPGSGVKAQWHQEVTNRIQHRFATVAARDAAWPAATAGVGALCVTLDTQTSWIVAAGPAWRELAGPTTPWTAAPFAVGWSNFGAPYQACQYRKRLDVVELRGLAKGGAAGSAILTLPAGFRPAGTDQYPSVMGGLFGYLSIANDGIVISSSGSTASVDLACCRFSVLP